MDLKARLLIYLTARPVGKDLFGNTYYAGKKKRWVIYAKAPDAANIPQQWHAWLHYRTDKIPPEKETEKYAWE